MEIELADDKVVSIRFGKRAFSRLYYELPGSVVSEAVNGQIQMRPCYMGSLFPPIYRDDGIHPELMIHEIR